MSGFWKFTSNYASRVSKILESKNIVLEDLLDERETVSELLASNAKLVEYLRRPEILEKLVDYVVEDDEYQRKEIEMDLQAREELEFDEENKLNNNNDTNNDNSDDHDQSENNNNNNQQDEGDDFKNEKQNDISQNDNDINNKTEKADTDSESSNENKKTNHHEENEQNDDEEDDNDDDDEDDDDEDDDDEDDDDDDDDDAENVEETEVEKHTRRAQVAAEILSIDVWSITDAFMENIELLQKLWCILDKPAPLPIFSATYFMKINEHLLDMKTDEMIQFIHQESNLVERFMRHIETPPLMDFLLKVISTDKPDDLTGIIDVLKDQGLIPSLINFLSSDVPSSIQSAAGDFLKAFITISANNAENTTIGPNELTRQLVSEPIVRLLVDKMLQGGTGLSNGVGIVIEIIRKNNSDYDPVPIVYVTVESHPPTPRDPIYLGTLVEIFAESLPKFNELLNKKVEKQLNTPFGTIEPLGFERFKICELVAELIHCSNMALLNDQNGAELVKERDEIRELLIEKHKELMNSSDVNSNNSLDASDVLKAVENLRLSKQSEETDENSNKEEVEDGENATNDELSQKENDGDEDDDELILRKKPVVGDQLKISLYDNKIIVTILDMFFKFPWNNFLHNVVFDIVQQILNATMEIGYNKYLAIDLFDRCHITRAIIEGHKKCTEYEEEFGLRLGYMGHLSLIAEEVVKFISLEIHHTTPKSSKIDESVENEEWKEYVDDILADIRNKYNAVLGSDGKQMNEHDMNLFQKVYGTSEYADDDDEDDDDVILDNNENGFIDAEADDDEDENNNNKNNNEIESDKFTRYIGEEITGDLPDRFGSSDDESEDENDVLIGNNSNHNDNNNIDNYNENNEIITDDIEGIVDSQMGGHPYHEMSAGELDDQTIDIDDDMYDEDEVDINGLDDEDNERYNGNNSYDDYDDYDDYEDPNDDGQSYKRNDHPLYQSDGSLRSSSSEQILGIDDNNSE